MHSRQMIHLPSASASGDHHVQPAPLHTRHLSFSTIYLSDWAIALRAYPAWGPQFKSGHAD